MKVGEIVRFEHKRWRVLSHSTDFRTCTLINFNLEKIEVPDDLDKGLELKVVANPENWPFVTIPTKITFGRLVSVTQAKMDLTRGETTTVTLSPLVDWMPGDFVTAGGSVFFNPSLGLKAGDVLVATHLNGKTQRISITRAFGSMKTMTARVEKKPEPMTIYKRILMDDVFGKD